MIELLDHFGVRRYSLVGAMYDMVPHTRPLLVSGLGTGPGADEERRRVKVQTSDYEGPSTITYLVTLEAIKRGIDTRTFVVHLPQYFQVDEDLAGTSRLMEILCDLYDLPRRLVESQRGKAQYAKLQDMVEDKAGVSSLLGRLEEDYDRERSQQDDQSDVPPLAPNIEEFLKDLDQGFDPPGNRG